MSRRLVCSVSIHDCKVETFTVGGHGGSGKDTSNTGVRITHEPSGAAGRCVQHRSQHRNKVSAFKKLATSSAFRKWAKEQARTGLPSIEAQIEASLTPENLKVETFVDGKWVLYVDA